MERMRCKVLKNIRLYREYTPGEIQEFSPSEFERLKGSLEVVESRIEKAPNKMAKRGVQKTGGV